MGKSQLFKYIDEMKLVSVKYVSSASNKTT